MNTKNKNNTVTGLAGTLAEELGYSDSVQQIESIFHILQLPLEEIAAEEKNRQEYPGNNHFSDSEYEYTSTINNDGVPLQIVISSSEERNGLGFLTETADMNHRQSMRVAAAGIRLDRIFQSAGAGLENVAARFKRISSILLPGSTEEIDCLRSGSCWIALRFLQSGRFYSSIYFTGKWGSEVQRFSRPLTLLTEFSCRESRGFMQSMESFLSGFCRPIGQAVSIGTARNGVCKFYYRAADPSEKNIEELYSRLGMNDCLDDFRMFSSAVLPPFPVFPEQSLVFSIEFDLEKDRFKGIKIDACSHCLPHGDTSYAERWADLLEHFTLSPYEYIRALEVLSYGEIDTETVNHAFLGIGHDSDGSRRLNAYLKPSDVTL